MKAIPSSRLTFSATHIVAFSVVAALAAFTAGMDSCDDCGLLPDAHAQSTTHLVTSSNTNTLQNTINNLASGATVTFSSDTFPDLGFVAINKPMTITGASDGGTILTGDSHFQIRGDDITIKNLTFQDIHNPDWDPAVIEMGWGSRTNITVSNNTMVNTESHAIYVNGVGPWTPTFNPPSGGNPPAPDLVHTNIRITDNVFRNIGTLYPDGNTDADNARLLYTVIRTVETGLFRNLFISNNTMDTASFAGINLAQFGLVNVHINGNTISNMLAFGVQKAVEAEVNGAKLAGADSSLSIYNNTFTNNNNAQEYLDGTAETVPEAAIVIWGSDDSNVRIYDNVIRNSHNGVLLCANTSCGVHEDSLGQGLDVFQVVDTPIEQFLTVFRNSFIGNTGFDLVNLSAAPVFAPFNYWDRSPEQRISGSASYSPYYTNEARTMIAELSTSQSSISPSTPSCSVSTGAPITFNLVTGGESPVASQTIRNAGSLAVTGVQVSVDAWTDAGDNEYSTLTTFVRTGGEFRELTPGQYLSVDSGLSAPASSSALEFKVVHSGRTLPAGEGTLSQTISLFGSCG